MWRRGAGLNALLARLGRPSCAESPEAGLSGEILLRAGLLRDTGFLAGLLGISPMASESVSKSCGSSCV